MKLPTPIVSAGLRGAAVEVLQSASWKRLNRLLDKLAKSDAEDEAMTTERVAESLWRWMNHAAAARGVQWRYIDADVKDQWREGARVAIAAIMEVKP